MFANTGILVLLLLLMAGTFSLAGEVTLGRYAGGAFPPPPDAPSEAFGFFPLVGWGPLSGWGDVSTLTAPVPENLAACGLTMAGFVPLAELPLCKKYGLAALVSDLRASAYDWRNVDPDEAEAKVKALVEATKDDPMVLGYFLKDEPTADQFAGLGVVARLFRKYAPDKWAFVNLLPNYANLEQLGCASYEEYLERFVKEVGCKVISYDNYSLMEDGSIRPGYFANLRQVRAAALAHQRLFMNVVLSNAHFNYALPTPATLRFQVYTTLAAGGRGIGYFTFYAPPLGNYRAAPIDQFGNETQTFDYLRNVNLQVLHLAPTVNRLTSTALYAWPKAHEGLSAFKPDALLAKLQAAQPLMVGEFKHTDGSDYVMLVNCSLTGSTPLEVKAAKAGQILQVSQYSGELVPFEGEALWLAPGQGVLLKLP